MKVVIFLCSLALVRAGVIGTIDYSPASYNNYAAPAPVYESVLSTHESRKNNFDGTQQTTFAKSLDTPYSSIKKFDSRTFNNDPLAHSVPVYSPAPILTQSHATTSVVSPVVHSISNSPVTYTAHPASFSGTSFAAPAITSLSAPVVTKTITPSLTSHGQPAVKITYSEAPLVSHMTFTGLGTSYSW